MRKMTKALMIGAVVAAVGGAGLTAMAETGAPGCGPGAMQGHMGYGMRGMGGGAREFGFGDPAAHLAALKTEIGIKPEQGAAWDAYAKIVRDTAAQMRATRAGMDMKTIQAMSPEDRTAFISRQREAHEAAFGNVKTAAEALLPTLDAAQKAKAETSLPGLVTRGEGGMQRAGMQMMRHGMGMMRHGMEMMRGDPMGGG